MSAQKLACHLTRGDVIRHERRSYRVSHVGLALAIPRSGGPSRSLTTVTMAPANGRGRFREVRFEQDALVALVAR